MACLGALVVRARLAKSLERHLNRGRQLGLPARLDQIGERPGVGSAVDHLTVKKRGEKDDGNVPGRADHACRLDPIHPWHADIHHHDVRMQPANGFEGLNTIHRFATHLIAGQTQHIDQGCPDHILVIDHQNA